MKILSLAAACFLLDSLAFPCPAAAESPSAGFASTVPQIAGSPGPAPEGMVWIPGGEFSMGAAMNGAGHYEVAMPSNDAEPVHRVRIDGFWMDRTVVTNEQFEKFVRATGYVTVAERTPRQEDFPEAPPENLVAGSAVFTAPENAVPLDNYLQWWSYVAEANWRHPEGPGSDLKGREKYPVVQVAYPDAEAYAKWAGKRLPTEAEYEFAERGGLSGKTYPWGNELRPEGKWMANTYQGMFPVRDKGEDGFKGLAPVAQFLANGYGLYDMAGNVWEWCSDWYRADYYAQVAKAGSVTSNPRGPESSSDPDDPGQKKRVQRGGSYLCNEEYCSRYTVGTRGKGEANTSTNHLGFRLVKSAPPKKPTANDTAVTKAH